MSTIGSGKRKREDDPPRITFSAPGRTFERLFKEQSLEALKNTVRKKLGLSSEALEFSQIRDGKDIDLEDEDDFDAFKSFAVSNGVAQVRVKVPTVPSRSGLPSQSQRITSSEETQPDPAAKDKSSHGGQDTPIEGPMTLTQLLMAGVMPLPMNTAKVNNAFSTNVPSQSNDNSELQSAMSNATGRAKVSRVKAPKRKDKQAAQAEPGTSIPEVPADVPSANHGRPGETSELPQGPKGRSKKSPLSKAKHVPETASADANLREVANLPGDRTDKAKGSQAKNDAAQHAFIPSNGTIPAEHPPTNSAMQDSLPRPTAESRPDATLVGPQKPKRKKGKKSNLVNGEVSPSGPLRVDSPTISAPHDETGKEKHVEGGSRQPAVTTEAPVLDEKKGRKRKLDSGEKVGTDASSITDSGKIKKRRTAKNNAAPKATLSQSENGKPNNSNVLQDASTSSKSSDATVNKAESPGERATAADIVDVDIDDAIIRVLRKRVSESSRQFASTAPVTTAKPAAAVVNETDLMNRAAEQSDDVINKSSANKNVMRTRNTNMGKVNKPKLSGTALILVDSNNVPSKTPSNNTIVVHNNSGKDLSTSQPNQKRKTSTNGNPAPTLNIVHSTATARASIVPAGSDISEIVVQRKGEGTSSDSSSGSDDSDSESAEEEETRTRIPQRVNKSHPGLSSRRSGHKVDSSLPTGKTTSVRSIDVDSLLHPKSSQSWRSIIMSPEIRSDSDEKFMSDEDNEDEEGEGHGHKRQRRSGFLARRSPSTSFNDDDDDDSSRDVEMAMEGGLREGSSGITYVVASQAGTPVLDTIEGDDGLEGQTDDRQPDVAEGRIDEDQPATSNSNESTGNARSGLVLASFQMPGPSRLPSFKDVNARGESVLTEGAANRAVNQAMEEDDTLFFSGLAAHKGDSSSTERPTLGEANDDNSLVNELASSESERDGDSGSSKDSEERNPSPAPYMSSAPTDRFSRASSKHDETVETSQQNALTRFVGSFFRSTPKATGPGRPGTVGRMKDRQGKVGAPKPPLTPITKMQIPDSEHFFDDPIESWTDSQKTTVERQENAVQTVYNADAASNRLQVGTEQPPGTRRVLRLRKRSGSSRSTSKGTGGSEDADSVSIEQGRQDEHGLRGDTTRPSQREQAKTSRALKPNASSAHYVPASGSEDTSDSKEEEPVSQKDDSHASAANVKANEDVDQTRTVSSGSATEVERSINGDLTMFDHNAPRPQSIRKSQNTKKQRIATSSDSEDSDAEDDRIGASMPQIRDYSHRPSITSVRSLQHIASKKDLFSPSSTPRPPYASSQATARSGLNGRNDEDSEGEDSSSSSSSSSDSGLDTERQSSIPKERRAGSVPAKPRGGVKSRLSSFLGLAS